MVADIVNDTDDFTGIEAYRAVQVKPPLVSSHHRMGLNSVVPPTELGMLVEDI
jgi:hypothetical protein